MYFTQPLVPRVILVHSLIFESRTITGFPRIPNSIIGFESEVLFQRYGGARANEVAGLGIGEGRILTIRKGAHRKRAASLRGLIPFLARFGEGAVSLEDVLFLVRQVSSRHDGVRPG